MPGTCRIAAKPTRKTDGGIAGKAARPPHSQQISAGRSTGGIDRTERVRPHIEAEHSRRHGRREPPTDRSNTGAGPTFFLSSTRMRAPAVIDFLTPCRHLSSNKARHGRAGASRDSVTPERRGNTVGCGEYLESGPELTQIAVEAAKPKKRANGRLRSRTEFEQRLPAVPRGAAVARLELCEPLPLPAPTREARARAAFTRSETPTGMTSAAARAANAQALHQVAFGIDPAAAKQAAKATSAEQEERRRRTASPGCSPNSSSCTPSAGCSQKPCRSAENSVGRRSCADLAWPHRPRHQERDVIDLTDRIAIDRPSWPIGSLRSSTNFPPGWLRAT